MGKGEIARYEQFLLFPQCFQKACFPGASKGVIVWEYVNQIDKLLTSDEIMKFSFSDMVTKGAEKVLVYMLYNKHRAHLNVNLIKIKFPNIALYT